MSLPALPFPSSLQTKNLQNFLFLLLFFSPLPVEGAVVDGADVLPPADGAADVGEDGDRQLVSCLQSVSDALGLQK